MAVTKIRKTSSITLLVVVAISVIVMGLFYFGGYVDPAAAKPEPTYTGALLYWTYALAIIAVLVTLLFGLVAFAASFKHSPKKAIRTIIVLVLFAALLGIAYAVGSADPLPLSQDFQEYNVPTWLKRTDMFLYSTYALIFLSIVGVLFGAVKNIFTKK
ncbi:MAG: hypothetical protein Q3998_01310 [Porphyromonas sp.]|nr:hypothetical protein [Porphyromonas sp.]